MRSLIDITALDRVGTVIESPVGSSVDPVDAVVILHMVEMIMFSDRILYIAFDEGDIERQVAGIVGRLRSEDCIPELDADEEHGNSLGDRWLLHGQPAVIEDYGECCAEAAKSAAEMFASWLSRGELKAIANVTGDASRPRHSTIDDVSKTLHEAEGESERSEAA